MNKAILMGRLTRDPDIRTSQGNPPVTIARFMLAVDRRFKREGEQNADFVSCVAFGKIADFIDNYMRQGTKIAVCGRIQTGSYTDREGRKVYTTDVIVEEVEFAESKKAAEGDTPREERAEGPAGDDDFMSIPDGLEDELPFN